MSQGDASHGSVGDGDTAQSRADRGDGERATALVSRVREHARSGTLAGVLGGAALLRGIRSLRAGERVRGLGRVVAGAGLLGVAAVQRRAGRGPSGERIDIDQTDVVDTAPDIDAVGSVNGDGDHADSEAATEVVDTGPDVEDAVESDDTETEAGEGNGTGAGGADSGGAAGGTTDETAAEEPEAAAADDGTDTGADAAADAEPETVTYDRLGAAAFDEHGTEVPVPQQAFNREFLALGGEAHWGVRDDRSVVVSERFDPIQGGEGVDYLASTRVDDERSLRVPDEVTDHWDDAVGGPMAVAGGDDIVFATSDDLGTDRQLLVLPAAWADEVLGEGA